MLVFYRLFTVLRVLVSVESSILPLGKYWFNPIHPGVKKVLSSFGDYSHRGIGMSYSKQRYISLIRDVFLFLGRVYCTFGKVYGIFMIIHHEDFLVFANRFGLFEDGCML